MFPNKYEEKMVSPLNKKYNIMIMQKHINKQKIFATIYEANKANTELSNYMRSDVRFNRII